MLIINADDWGRSAAETEAALKVFKNGRITSVTAMMFMDDSERAAALAMENGINCGLHLNFAEQFTGMRCPEKLRSCQGRIVSFLMRNKYSPVLYNPFLRRHFAYSYRAQADEFARLHGKPPTHVDGHHHMHLCSNVLLSSMVPLGMKVRRNFSFFRGEKGSLNRAYRAAVDCWLSRRYRLADYFFNLLDCTRENKRSQVASLTNSYAVELMAHPVVREESQFLMGKEFAALTESATLGSYASL